jgi:hypothetical protein
MMVGDNRAVEEKKCQSFGVVWFVDLALGHFMKSSNGKLSFSAILQQVFIDGMVLSVSILYKVLYPTPASRDKDSIDVFVSSFFFFKPLPNKFGSIVARRAEIILAYVRVLGGALLFNKLCTADTLTSDKAASSLSDKFKTDIVLLMFFNILILSIFILYQSFGACQINLYIPLILIFSIIWIIYTFFKKYCVFRCGNNIYNYYKFFQKST